VGFLIGASIVVETLFAMPGIGSFGVDAIIKRDYPQVQAFVLVGALVFVLANLSVDLLYCVIDPRIQYGKEGA
jgi:peptide/nickel transport system permease protein